MPNTLTATVEPQHSRRVRLRLGLASLCALALACGSDAPAHLAGTYMLTTVNGANGCAFDNWTEGSVSQLATPLTVTQDSTNLSHATGVVGGVPGVYLLLLAESTTFAGTVSGSHLDMNILGTRPVGTGACGATLNAYLSADVSGDTMTGTLVFRYNTNRDPSCGIKTTCATTMSFNGTRPPSP